VGQVLWLGQPAIKGHVFRTKLPHSTSLGTYRYCVFRTLGVGSRRGRNVSSSLSSEMRWLHGRDSDRQTWPRGCARPTPEVPLAIKRTTMMSQNGSRRSNGTHLTTHVPRDSSIVTVEGGGRREDGVQPASVEQAIGPPG
jgi:hypothetical protein